MVTITASTPSVRTDADVSVSVEKAPIEIGRSSPALLCVRCDTRLMIGYYEPQCPSCGYVDYSHRPENSSDKGTSVISTATRYVLRYVGEFTNFTDTLAHVRLVRVRNRVIFAVNCPFCDKAMDQSSLSGKRHELREQRYKCMDGHRVSLVPSDNGAALGWK